MGGELRALADLLFGAIDGVTRGIEETHFAIARRPFAAVDLVPAARAPGAPVRVAHDGITAGVYGAIRAANAVVAAVVAPALAAVGELLPASPASPQAGLALGALNGAIGDRLERQESPLRVRMAFRDRGRELLPEAASLRRALPDATSKIAVFVHGLCCSERVWSFYSERHYGRRGTTHGTRLGADLGYTPLYLRYNSGLHVSENGRQLARLLDELVSVWPVEVEEIAFIGHSMGGLVARSACHYGREDGRRWVDRVRHVVCLGAPHLGTPLEKLANVGSWLCRVSDITRPFARVADGRSAGIKDLRFGYVVDDDWQGAEPDTLLENRRTDVPFLDSASYYFVGATITRDPSHPAGAFLGDTLVRLASAMGRARRGRSIPVGIADDRHFGGMGHLQLLNHPAVYEQIREWLGAAVPSAPEYPPSV